MSSVIVVAPVIIANWPVISAAVTAACGTLGFSLAQAAAEAVELSTQNRAEIDIENSEVLGATAGVEQKLVVQRGALRATFTRDARGALKLCMEGPLAKSELKRAGEELMGSVTQQYVYHRVMSELQARSLVVIDEEVTADRAVKIRVRNFG